jgi:hypothetical protein
MSDAPPRLDARQAAIVGLYTGYVAGPVEDIQHLAEELAERPVWTHELAAGNPFVPFIRQLALPLFLSICHEREYSLEDRPGSDNGGLC